MERVAWNIKLQHFMFTRSTPVARIPIINHEPLDLFALYHAVMARGGCQTVTDLKLWRQVAHDLALADHRSDVGFRLRRHYETLLYDFECFNRATAQGMSESVWATPAKDLPVLPDSCAICFLCL